MAISNKLKQQIQNCMVVEYCVFRRRKILKFFGEFISIYAGISNKYNVQNIIA